MAMEPLDPWAVTRLPMFIVAPARGVEKVSREPCDSSRPSAAGRIARHISEGGLKPLQNARQRHVTALDRMFLVRMSDC